MDVIGAIRRRRSVRKFLDQEIDEELLVRLIDTARWAPSGLNNQPWRFMKITDPGLIEEISHLTRYRGVVAGAVALIIVFLDEEACYNRTKDLQSAGAAIQNILLAANSLDLGACWLGEILNKREEVESLLGVPDSCELMAVVALGYPGQDPGEGTRHPLESFILFPPEKNSRPSSSMS